MNAIGFVVNPIAGMGGRVGLKGTDDKLEEARRRGAEPRAPDRGRDALETLVRLRPELTVYTAAGSMGESVASAAGFEPNVVFEPDSAATFSSPEDTGESEPAAENGQETTAKNGWETTAENERETTAEDTRGAVRSFLERGVDLVLFVGGDGTAADVAEVLEQAGAETPMLGVPAGVKIYSSVFAVAPADAGRVAAEFDRVELREVNDIDEAAYRDGIVRSELKAVVSVPVAPEIQSSKQLASGNVDSLAAGYARDVDPEMTYVFGPGSTVGRIERELGIDASPLGVDVWRDGEILTRDATEDEILATVVDPFTIVVSPIGGQGFLFGRGNHQLSPAVIRRSEALDVVASGEKLDGIGAFRVDTDDDDLDERLRGWVTVRTGRYTTRLVKVV
ncbi:N-acetylglucosamine-1-phosphate uridyltransferase [Halostagnicola larsenii XH-48]|uniref:N-acetylglucosamine-1-phosphate uridyltransferase n=1 Tax=Halostagnicola larsenii XH-48 TaxID=797299 RepID=W0JQB5_9EURY|nr:ATP-NAD kinase family protein [Halostagnicola larsenii]AHF99192.1 N-acetylglucosamine-1-phosphate uridyltransferase [Halostagnicola larsenii XH-48]